MSAYTPEKLSVTASEAIEASRRIGVLTKFGVIGKLVDDICNGIPYEPSMGSDWVRFRLIHAAIFTAGRIQGIREERERRRKHGRR